MEAIRGYYYNQWLQQSMRLLVEFFSPIVYFWTLKPQVLSYGCCHLGFTEAEVTIFERET